MELRTRPGQRLVVAIAVLGALIITALLLPRFGGPTVVPGPSPFELRATFPDVLGLQSAAEVRIRGVDAGEVAAVTRIDGDVAVRIRLRHDVARLITAGTTARIGQKTPLGEAFVDVAPGPVGASQLPEKARIATTASVTFGRALRALGTDTHDDTTEILTALERSMARPDAPDALAATIEQGRRIAGAFRGLAETLRGQTSEISGLVRNTRVAVETLAEHQADVRGVVENGQRTLTALGANEQRLEDGLVELQPVTRSATRALATLDPLLREARPLVDDLIAAAPDLTQALRRLPATARDAAVVLDATPALTRAARPVLRDARPLLRAAGPALSALAPTLANLVPMTGYLQAKINSVVAWFTNTGSVGASGDSKSRWVRFLLFMEPGILAGVKDATPGNTYPRPNDALANEAYVPGSYPRLRPHAPGLPSGR